MASSLKMHHAFIRYLLLTYRQSAYHLSQSRYALNIAARARASEWSVIKAL